MYRVNYIQDGDSQVVDALWVDSRSDDEIKMMRDHFFCPDCGVQMTFFTRSDSGTNAHFKTRVKKRHDKNCSKVTILSIDDATEEIRHIINDVQKAIQETDFFKVVFSPTTHDDEDQTFQQEDESDEGKIVIRSQTPRDYHSKEPAKRCYTGVSLKRILILLVHDELEKLQKKVKVKADIGDKYLEFNVSNYFIRLEQATTQKFSRCYWGKISTISSGYQYINTDQDYSNQVIIIIDEAIREKLAKRYRFKENKTLKNTYVIIHSTCKGKENGKRWINVDSLADISIQRIRPK